MKCCQPKPAEVRGNLIIASESGQGWIPWKIMKIDREKWRCFLPAIVTTCFCISLLWFAITFFVMAPNSANFRICPSPVYCPYLWHFADNHCYRIQSCLWYRETETCLLNYINHIQHDRLLLLSFKGLQKLTACYLAITHHTVFLLSLFQVPHQQQVQDHRKLFHVSYIDSLILCFISQKFIFHFVWQKHFYIPL